MMISFDEALDLLLAHAPRLGIESCDLEIAVGRVLRQEVLADRAFPPFDRVMMDGYALRNTELQTGDTFRVAVSAPAGQAQVHLPESLRACAEVMTGAPLPRGADCIVPVERTTRLSKDEIRVAADFKGEEGLFVHRYASDAKQGEVLLPCGVLIGSREIATAASCGVSTLRVSQRPRITIIPTGDELVRVDEIPAAHQIRQSNGYALRSALQAAGYSATMADVLPDDADATALVAALASNDWLILTGAISKGARDFLPKIFEQLGCRKLFHGVAQRPGKPAGCWLGPEGQMIIALPGNPVSALTGLHAFVLPALAVASGRDLPVTRMVATESRIIGLPEMTWHLPVTLSADGLATAAPTGNSGDVIGLLRSHGFIRLTPRDSLQFTYPFTPWL